MYEHFKRMKEKYYYDLVLKNVDDDLRIIAVDQYKNKAFRGTLAFLLADERGISRLHFETIEQLKRVRDLLQLNGRGTSIETTVTPEDSLPR